MSMLPVRWIARRSFPKPHADAARQRACSTSDARRGRWVAGFAAPPGLAGVRSPAHPSSFSLSCARGAPSVGVNSRYKNTHTRDVRMPTDHASVLRRKIGEKFMKAEPQPGRKPQGTTCPAAAERWQKHGEFPGPATAPTCPQGKSRTAWVISTRRVGSLGNRGSPRTTLGPRCSPLLRTTRAEPDPKLSSRTGSANRRARSAERTCFEVKIKARRRRVASATQRWRTTTRDTTSTRATCGATRRPQSARQTWRRFHPICAAFGQSCPQLDRNPPTSAKAGPNPTETAPSLSRFGRNRLNFGEIRSKRWRFRPNSAKHKRSLTELYAKFGRSRP